MASTLNFIPSLQGRTFQVIFMFPSIPRTRHNLIATITLFMTQNEYTCHVVNTRKYVHPSSLHLVIIRGTRRLTIVRDPIDEWNNSAWTLIIPLYRPIRNSCSFMLTIYRSFCSQHHQHFLFRLFLSTLIWQWLKNNQKSSAVAWKYHEKNLINELAKRHCLTDIKRDRTFGPKWKLPFFIKIK